jgi:hypothetical protein
MDAFLMFISATLLFISSFYFRPSKIVTWNFTYYTKRIIVISGILAILSILFHIIPFLVVYPTCGNNPPCSHPLVAYLINDYYIILIGLLGIISLLWFPTAASQFVYAILKNKSLENKIAYQGILLGFILILLISHGALTYIINRLD